MFPFSFKLNGLVGTGSRSTAFKELPASLFFVHNSKNKNRWGKDLVGKRPSGEKTDGENT